MFKEGDKVIYKWGNGEVSTYTIERQDSLFPDHCVLKETRLRPKYYDLILLKKYMFDLELEKIRND